MKKYVIIFNHPVWFDKNYYFDDNGYYWVSEEEWIKWDKNDKSFTPAINIDDILKKYLIIEDIPDREIPLEIELYKWMGKIYTSEEKPEYFV